MRVGEAIPCERRSTKYEIEVLNLIFGATLSRRYVRQIFTSFLSRRDLSFVHHKVARQSQQKLQLCTLFLYSH